MNTNDTSVPTWAIFVLFAGFFGLAVAAALVGIAIKTWVAKHVLGL